MRPLLCGAFAVLLIALPLHAENWDCRTVPLRSGDEVGHGPEDFELDPTPGASRLIVASKPPFVVPVTASGLGTPQPIPVEPAGMKLHMIGISAVLANDGTPLLYAINKHRGIEVFEIKPDTLVHVRSIPPTKPRDLANANEVFAFPNGHVYVSRSHGRAGLLWFFESLFSPPWAKLMFFDGTVWHEQACDLRFGNGLQSSEDGRHLYVAAFAGKEIRRYHRGPDGKLTNPDLITLPAHPDNLKWSGPNTLITAAHPSKWRLAPHVLFKLGAPRSEVYEIDVREKSNRPIFHDEGSIIPAASTVHRDGERMFISQIVRPWLADCARKETNE